MLIGISPRISPELLDVLYRMGHGDELVLADAHFPGESVGRCVVRADGLKVEELLEAILPLFPLDEYVETPLFMMEPVPGDTFDPGLEARYRRMAARFVPAEPPIGKIERFAFYERARGAFAVVMTGDTAKYSNLILKKGVTPVSPLGKPTMDTLTAIRTRRSIGRVRQELPPKEAIELILEAATWAPNHFRVEPWRFVVLTGKSREELGEVFGEVDRESVADPAGSEGEEKARLGKAKALRAPVLIAVIVERVVDSRAIESENAAATAAAVQNLLLAAHAIGLGAVWRTGAYAYHPKVQAFLGVEPGESLAGLIYVGYPDMDPPAAKRAPLSEKAIWRGNVEGGYDAP